MLFKEHPSFGVRIMKRVCVKELRFEAIIIDKIMDENGKIALKELKH